MCIYIYRYTYIQLSMLVTQLCTQKNACACETSSLHTQNGPQPYTRDVTQPCKGQDMLQVMLFSCMCAQSSCKRLRVFSCTLDIYIFDGYSMRSYVSHVHILPRCRCRFSSCTRRKNSARTEGAQGVIIRMAKQ